MIIGQDGQLRRVFTEEEKVAYTARQTKEKCSDIDGDGIIEIPSTKRRVCRRNPCRFSLF